MTSNDSDFNEKFKDIVASLNSIFNDWQNHKSFNDTNLAKFKETSLILSSMLPAISKKDLLEIDDLMYPDEDMSIIKHSEIFSTNFADIEHLTMKCIVYYISNLKNAEMELKSSYIFDVTFLKLIDNIPQIKLVQIFENNMILFTLTSYIDYLICSRNERRICFVLKFLRLCSENSFRDLIFSRKSLCSLLPNGPWLANLMNIPQARHPNRKRITTWISKQSSSLQELFDDGSTLVGKFNKDYNKLCQNMKNTNHTVTPLKNICNKMMEFIFDSTTSFQVLHLFLKSAPNEENQVDLFMIFLNFWENKMKDQPKYIEIMFNLANSLKRVVSLIHKCLRDIIQHCEYNDIHLKQMDKCFRHEYEPYLSKFSDDIKNEIIENTGNQKIKETIHDLKVCSEAKEVSDEPDFTIEKFLFFDDFMKGMHLLKIMNIAFKKYNEENCPNEKLTIKCGQYNFKKALLDPSQRGEISWLLEILIRNCHFLFLGHHDKLKEDLINMLKGKVDEFIDEKLSLAMNTELQFEA